MKKFQFSLESLIEHRLREEREALHRLGIELETQIQARKRWELAVRTTGSCKLRIKSVIDESTINSQNLHTYRAYLNDLEKIEEQARFDLESCREAVKVSKEAYYRKKAETDILVKLREKSYSEHLRRLEKMEAMETDDLVMASHARKHVTFMI